MSQAEVVYESEQFGKEGIIGMPQESVLGPFLFTIYIYIYIGDLVHEICMKVKKFADETKLENGASKDKRRMAIKFGMTNRLRSQADTASGFTGICNSL